MPDDVSRSMNDWFVPKDHEVVYYTEGIEGTVMVTGPTSGRIDSDRVLWINAVQATASIEKGVKMNRFQGVLPLFFDRKLDNALFMCFGSGVTAGTLALSPFEQIDTVEISRDVLESAQYFKTDNFDVLSNDRINPIIDDGRNYLLTTDKQYDLITFEPMPLALSGVSTFYTREYYELCLAHLSEEGLVSQWIPLHNGLSIAIIKSLMKTFADVFPEVSV
jgi:spermidine synthase